MKKLILLCSMVAGSFLTLSANEFKLDDQNIENLMSSAAEYTVADMQAEAVTMQSNVHSTSTAAFKGDGDFTGYLLRAFFCGTFGVHRMYMGTGDRKNMWLLYTCTLGGGLGIGSCIDFWWPIFDRDALGKYSDNRKFWVFLKD
jgi:TM2 domain-containing membrane protein YozV